MALCHALEDSDRFRRDTGLGNIFHRGKTSFRELCPTDSMHIIIDGHRVSAHVDLVSPLRCRADGSVHYSLARVVAHNLFGMCSDLARLVRGRHGHQRCNLECEVVWVDNDTANTGATAATGAEAGEDTTAAAACPNEHPPAL